MVIRFSIECCSYLLLFWFIPPLLPLHPMRVGMMIKPTPEFLSIRDTTIKWSGFSVVTHG